MDELGARISRDIAHHAAAVERLPQIAGDIERAAKLLVASAASGGTLLVCGNGGSAADAQHIAAEYTGRFLIDRAPLPAIALHTNTSALTAVGNDYGFSEVFARQVRAFGKPGDVLLAISTSGGSPNVIAAMAAARELGMPTVALTGEGGGPMADAANVAIAAPGDSTPRVQEMHILIGHILCGIVEEQVCAKR